MPKRRIDSSRFSNIRPDYNFKPEELRCRKCDKTYSISGFTVQKLHELYKFLKNHNGNGPLPRTVCKNCTPNKNSELKCYSCQHTKPLSKYSKNQRTRKQFASCISCIEKHQNEDVESSGAEYSDLGPVVTNNNQFSTSSQQSCSVYDQFSFMHKEPPTNSISATETMSPTEIPFQKYFQSVYTDTIPPFNTEISSLYQLIGRKNQSTKIHSIIFSNTSEMNENLTPDTSYIKNDTDPVREALHQFPSLGNILHSIGTSSNQTLDSKTQQFRSKNLGRQKNNYTQ